MDKGLGIRTGPVFTSGPLAWFSLGLNDIILMLLLIRNVPDCCSSGLGFKSVSHSGILKRTGKPPPEAKKGKVILLYPLQLSHRLQYSLL